MNTTAPPRPNRWRIAFALGGALMAVGGPLHPESDAEDPLRTELATMTASDTWVLSHTLLAIGTILLVIGQWSAVRNRSWPSSMARALRVVAVTMSLYAVETVVHLASAVDSDALANGDAAPVAFTHIGLALVLYPLSGLTFAWLNTHLLRSRSLSDMMFGVVGVIAGLLHASSVPLTVAFPDTEFTPVFASAGMALAAWSLGLGLVGLRGRSPEHGDPALGDGVPGEDARAEAYRASERRLWLSLGAHPSEHFVELQTLGTRVRVQELGEGEPVVYVHGGPSAGTTWAPLAAALTGYRSFIVDRPGTGLSEPWPVRADNLDLFADHFLLDLLDALDLERAHVVASSFGGFLALRTAAVAPERVDRMVQMGCPAGVPGMSVPPFMRAAAVAPLRRLITALPSNERSARSVLGQIGHAKSVAAGRFTPEFMGWYLSLQRDTNTMRNELPMVGSLMSAGGAVRPALALSGDLLRSVGTRALFYWGLDDPFGGAGIARTTAAALPNAALELVGDAGHLPWLDDPASAARAVASFLSDCDHVQTSADTSLWSARGHQTISAAQS